MTGPSPAVAAVRRAVRTALADLAAGDVVLVAVSGGADSMALAAATGFEARTGGWQRAAVVVDHRLQPDSDAVAEGTGSRLEALGFDRVVVTAVDVGDVGGPEAAARAARYAAIDRVADDLAAAVVLLGHTLDDQAESVLLGLARGSGARSIRGMAPVRGRYRRPLLGVGRTTTREACRAEGLEFWDDPHNDDPSFTRARLRTVVPLLDETIGPGIVEALGRTAASLADDDDALEQWAQQVRTRARTADDAGRPALDVAELEAVPPAVRRRVLRSEALECGVPGGALRASHLADVEALVAGWKGQGPVHLPVGVRAWRDCGRLVLGQQAAEREP